MGFKRHKHLSYNGYHFPWFITLFWIMYVVGGAWYLIKHLLVEAGG